MGKKSFDSLMLEAYARKGRTDTSDYFDGYTRGLRRFFQGESSKTTEEDSKWLSRMEEEKREDEVHGYRDGFNGLTPNSDRWGYCTRNNCDCRSCALVNSGRDCFNSTI
jgi:hypothetical protein